MTVASILHGDCLDVLPTLPDKSVQLTLGSPPYVDARSYDDGTLPQGHRVEREARDWVSFMLDVTDASLRVTDGPVVWVAGNVTRGRNYWPACEGLMWEWFKRGGHAYRPCYWHRVGIPGSGGDQWFRSDVEYAMCFKREGPLPWTDNTAMGSPPKYRAGGKMSNRKADGSRSGENAGTEKAKYVLPKISNPGNLIHTKVGGGHLGDRIAHENEAPYPEKLCEFFIRSLCPPGGTVLDPFSGSGTTAKVALVTGRKAIGIDIRSSQVELSKKRVSTDASAQRELL